MTFILLAAAIGLDHGDELEVDEVLPPLDPNVEQRRIVGVHELEATIHSFVVDDPACR